ncbi:MAG: type II toxin-antitoxin system VapC family toxin [Victivallales bacterium]|jgi:PIN domain nuclease of toxin-antitoxin system
MKILLDTHVLIWAVEKPEELGKNSKGLLEDGKNEIFISPVSTLEIAQLINSGRIELNQTLNSWIKKVLRNLKVETVPFTHETAETAYRMQEPFHKDPADRILVATAVLENLSLMTADERILNYKHLSAINARK